jgi:hypothetical protein
MASVIRVRLRTGTGLAQLLLPLLLQHFVNVLAVLELRGLRDGCVHGEL